MKDERHFLKIWKSDFFVICLLRLRMTVLFVLNWCNVRNKNNYDAIFGFSCVEQYSVSQHWLQHWLQDLQFVGNLNFNSRETCSRPQSWHEMNIDPDSIEDDRSAVEFVQSLYYKVLNLTVKDLDSPELASLVAELDAMILKLEPRALRLASQHETLKLPRKFQMFSRSRSIVLMQPSHPLFRRW